MNFVAAASTGFGLGLAYFGGLWMSVRGLKNGRLPRWFILSRMARLVLAAVTFFALVKTGGLIAAGAGLCGLLAARRYLIREIGGIRDVR